MATQDELRAHKERAVAALSRGDLDEAAREFSSAIYLDPRDVILRQRLADLLARLGRKQEAVVQFQQIAGHHAAKGELLRAIAISRTILDLDPQHEETQKALAQLYARRSGAGTPKPASLPPSMSAAVHPARPAADAPAVQPAPRTEEPSAPRADYDESREVAIDLSQTQRTPLFSSLDEEGFAAVIARLQMRWAKAGEVLVREGEPGSSMFVIVQGEAEVLRGDPAPGKARLATLGEGAFFGEMALVASSPRLATVAATKDSLLFEIDREALEALSRAHPDVGRVVAQFYRDRLLANLLAVSPIFRVFSEDERRRIAARFVLRSLPAGTHILEQDRAGAGLFCLLRGQCQPEHTSADGAVYTYPPLREGELFGEISLLFGTLCTATVRALTHVEVLELPAPDFRALVLPHREVREMIDRVARERLTLASEHALANDRAMDGWIV